MEKANNKLIAKNAGLLYIRMIIMMGITLYTSRVVLDVLGVSDYGIYNIVGGIVIFFHFFNSTMSGTLQRFYNVEMGKDDYNGLRNIYNTGNTLLLLLSVCVILLLETLGVYFLNFHLNIDDDRMFAANIVLQSSILTFCINFLRIPHQAILIASEKMSFYAYISIFEALSKLLVVYLLLLVDYDKLIIYSIFQMLISLVILFSFIFQVNKQFKFRFHFTIDKKTLRDVLFFSGWNILGASFALTVNQIIGIFLNIYYGVILNASAGIAAQVSGAINQFSSNLAMAFSPQIVKLYSANDLENFRKLMYRSSKTSFLLYFLVALPFICMADNVIDLWLVEVPIYAVIFTQLCVVDLAIESFTFPMYSSIQAAGKVKWFNIGISLIFISNIPIVYLVLWLGWPPYSVYIVKIFTDIICLMFRIYYMKKSVGIQISEFCKNVIKPCCLLVLMVLPIALLCIFINKWIIQIICVIFLLLPLQLFLSLLICFDYHERRTIIDVFKRKISLRINIFL